MNSFWNKNIELFEKRFPQMYQIYKNVIDIFSQSVAEKEITEIAFPDNVPNWTISMSKTGIATAKDGTTLLHSAYNPQREAEQAAFIQEEGKDSAGVFLGFGIGYTVQTFSKKYPERPVIIIEPDIRYVLAAFATSDWKDVLEHKECIMAIAAPVEQIVPILEHFDITRCQFFLQNAHIAHAAQYFNTVKELAKRNIRKNEINNRTLEVFSKIWMKNSCSNLFQFAKSAGISRYANVIQESNLPVVVLAAGPSLETILPHLSQIKKRAIIVCVDTALRSCLAYNVEPDFIVLVDPQYWAYRHIAGLKAPSSILIAESAVYPAALRFECKEIVMCSSMFPLGKYFESILGKKGELGAGGSVSTSAWDFAKLTGTKSIYIAGLDLGFPGKNTHVRGTSFEENIHSHSTRTNPSETSGTTALYGCNPVWSKDFQGNPILTDDRMKMYSWWFESNVAKASSAQNSQKTFTLTPQSSYIPGIIPFSLNDFLSFAEMEKERKEFFEKAEQKPSMSYTKEVFDEKLKDFLKQLDTLKQTAKHGITISENALRKSTNDYNQVFAKLNDIDTTIFSSRTKEVASLVFPTQNQLDKIMKETPMPTAKEKQNLTKSKILYTQLVKAINICEKNLSKLNIDTL